MPKLTRNGQVVELTQPGYKVRFIVPFGGAPLEQYQTDGPVPVSIISQPSGEGAQVLADTGQDWTQASGTGRHGNIVKPIGVPYVKGNEYYARETIFLPDRDGHEAVYAVEGPFPAFWISVDREDDVIPPDPRGPHGWSLKYNDILNLGPDHYINNGVPIYFVPRGNVPSGILLLGDTIKYFYTPQAPWYEKIARIERGHIAFRFSVSMKTIRGNGMLGFMFGIDANLDDNSDINTIYNSPWSALFVNNQGGIDFHDRGRVTTIIGPNTFLRSKIRSDQGLYLELRTTERNTVQVYADYILRGEYPRSAFGPYAGVIASATDGHVQMRDREVFDMGINFSAIHRSTPRNTMLQTLSAWRVREPFVQPAYRMNLPVMWIDPAIREAAKMWDLNGQEQPLPADSFPLMKDISAIYAGKADGSAGYFCRIHGFTGGQLAHAGVTPTALGLNNLSFNANHIPENFSFHSVTSEVAPRIRTDLLPPNG